MNKILIAVLVLLVGLQQGCSVLLSGVGTSWTEVPGFPTECSERSAFESSWGPPVAEVVDQEGHRYSEYRCRVHAPRGMQSGFGEAMWDMSTLGLAEVVLTPTHLARLAGAMDYTMEVRVEWEGDGSAAGFMIRKQEAWPTAPQEWTRRDIATLGGGRRRSPG